MGTNDTNTSTNEIALSQDEVDKLLKNATPKPVKKSLPKETEEKIKALKEKAAAVAKKMNTAEKKPASKKSTAKKAPAKKTTAKKAAPKVPAKKAAPAKKAGVKKPVNKMTVYFEGKAYGTGTVVTKNGKKIIELLSIKKK